MPRAEPSATRDAPALPGTSRILFPWPPRRFRWARPVQLLLRTVHIVAMALVLGGVAFRVPEPAFAIPIVLTVASGVLLLAVDLARSGVFLYLAAGFAVHLKLILLLLGNVFPEARLAFYLAATVVASVGSHMSGPFRHYSFVHRRVLEHGGPKRRGGPSRARAEGE